MVRIPLLCAFTLKATWYLLDASPYMVLGEVPLPDGQVQRFSEVEIPRSP